MDVIELETLEDIEAQLLEPCSYCKKGIDTFDAQVNRTAWPQFNLGDKCYVCLGSGLQRDNRYCSECGYSLAPTEREAMRCEECGV